MCCCFIIFFLFVHAFIHSSTCLVTDQTKLGLKSLKNMCKCSWRLYVSMSLPFSLLPHCLLVSAVFKAWGENAPQIAQCRVRS